MDFDAVLAQVHELLQRQGRRSCGHWLPIPAEPAIPARLDGACGPRRDPNAPAVRV
jgi:hypothetical protein